MKCINCGNEVSAGNRFCANCGAEQPQQEAPQGSAPPPSFTGGNIGGSAGVTSEDSKIILTVFCAICGALYGYSAIRGLIHVPSNLLYGLFGLSITQLLNFITGAWLCAFLIFTAFRWNREISDGLLLCICGGGIVRVIIQVLTCVILHNRYYGFSISSIGWCFAGAVVTVAGVYAILRFLLGENPILGKTAQDLQNDLATLFMRLGEIIGSLNLGSKKAAQPQGQYMQGQGMQPQDQYAQGQGMQPQDQYAQGQGMQPQGQYVQGQGMQPQDQYAQGQGMQPQGQYMQGQPMQQQGQYMQNNQANWNGGQTPNGQFGAYGQMPPGGGAPFRLKTDRSLIMYIVLTIVTCGIYSFYFIYALARDINVACDGDGRKTGGLIKYILLSIVTCGIYSLIWLYGVGNRLAENAPRYGMNFQENGTTVLLWQLFGALLCGIGPFMALHIIIKNTNMVCGAYNHSHGM